MIEENNGDSFTIKSESLRNDDDNNADNNNEDDYIASNETNDDAKTNLIVNYLPQQMLDEEFEELFKKFGEMKSCKIVRNRSSGYSYGFGFVDFATHEQALKAIEELNGHELETKKIKVAFARPAGQDIKQANLYIKNIPNTWSQDDVRKIFEPYGNIIQVRVLGNNRGVAFVLYDLRKQAEDALEALNGKTVDGCEAPFEIKFAADKKVEKGSSSKNAPSSSGTPQRRERGRRGGKNRDRHGRPDSQKRVFERQNNFNDRQGGIRGGNHYNPVPYGGGAQYQDNFSNMNGIGPMRQATNRMNRYAPFIAVQQAPMVQASQQNPMAPQMTSQMAPQLAPQMTPNPTFGYPGQQPMIPFTMVPTQQMVPLQTVNQTGQIAQNPMAMYSAQIPMAYPQAAQTAMNNIYSVASNNMNNAANMQPQLGQPMAMRNSNNSNNGAPSQDEGVTLFVYNIGPDADENELRTMFSPYGQVIKCNVVRKTPGGETKGFGFVTLKDRGQANSAIAGLNGSMRNGRALQVSLKK